MNQIKSLAQPDDGRESWDDLQWVEEFFGFLKGRTPDNINLRRGHIPKMSEKKAFSIIWYLQGHFRILPDNIEKCSNCLELYDANSGGLYWESKFKNFCDGCSHLVPENYDRGKR